MTFQPGNTHGKGGKREGAGRPPNWLRDKCAALVDKRKLTEFLADTAAGKALDFLVLKDGTKIKVPAGMDARVRAAGKLIEVADDARSTMKHDIDLSFLQFLVARLQDIFKRVVPEKCPHCKTLLAIRPELAKEMEKLSETIDV